MRDPVSKPGLAGWTGLSSATRSGRVEHIPLRRLYSEHYTCRVGSVTVTKSSANNPNEDDANGLQLGKQMTAM